MKKYEVMVFYRGKWMLIGKYNQFNTAKQNAENALTRLKKNDIEFYDIIVRIRPTEETKLV